MRHNYRDIRERMSEPVRWFDEYAVPRYCEFVPKEVADIYAHEAALLEIACQDCGTIFEVAVSRSTWARWVDGRTLAENLATEHYGWGDPPNIGCCAAGPTMTSDFKRLLQYWHKEKFDWRRDDGLPERIAKEKKRRRGEETKT